MRSMIDPRGAALFVLGIVVAACSGRPRETPPSSIPPVVDAAIADPAPVAPAPPPAPPDAVAATVTVRGPAAAIAHGGVGADSDADGVRAAVDAAVRVLEAGGDPLDAAVAGVVVMEDDPRFNAGTGSIVRLDGKTVQMDASVMRSDGKFAAVAAIEDVKNPIRVARAVLDSPHVLMVGDGATRFARTLGMNRYDPATPEMRAAAKDNLAQLVRGDAPEWRGFDWRKHWNFARSLSELGVKPVRPEKKRDSDTVGVVARSADGRFGVALSTGGRTITLRGRVGDVPIYG